MTQKVYVWGDSIAKGIIFDAQRGRYVGLRERSGLEQAAHDLDVELENHAHFGMTTQKGKLVVAKGMEKVEAGRPVVLGFGGNDVDFNWAAIADAPSGHHDPNVTLDQFGDNMAQMVHTVRSAGLRPVLMTLPPIDSTRYFDWVTRGLEHKQNVLQWLGDVDRIYRTHKGYSDLLTQVAQTLNVNLVDVRGAFEKAGETLSRLCVDGIHPNAQGHDVIHQALTQYALVHEF